MKYHPSPSFRHLELIKMAAVVFWQAYLRDEAEALEWLRNGGYAAAVGDAGRFGFKLEE